MDRAGFRTAVDSYRRPTGYTQQQLARAMGLHPKTLSHKLHGSDSASLRHDDVRAIVRVLTEWGALTKRTQAINLLALMGLARDSFAPSEWAASPLMRLEVDDEPSPIERRHGHGLPAGYVQRGWLPAEPTPLVGRTDEVHEVLELLESGARLVTLTGIGGTGKTRLALAVAATMAQRSTEQVRMVALATILDPELVPAAIAAELGLRESEGGGARIEDVLLEYLRDHQVVLVLDNLEQVLASAPFVARMLRAAAGLRVLATSRVALRIYGEHEFRVPPLRLSPPGASEEEVLASEAVALFIARARAARADFRASPAQAGLLNEICTRLDGLPLGVELAAAHVRHLPLQLLLERLANRLDVLAHGPRDVPARQRTLRATLDWSYALLSPARQRLFEILGVFVGGCTLEAAQSVCGDAGEDIDDGLWELADHALVEASHGFGPDGALAETRFGMLETVREYAQARLAERGDAALTRSRHRDWFVAWLERAAPQLAGPDQAMWYERVAAELDNCRAARVWSRLDPQGAEGELRLAAALGQYFHIRAPGSEARDCLTVALARGPDLPSAARATALTWLGQSEYLAGEVESGRACLSEAVAVARHVGTSRLLTLALRHDALYVGDETTAQGLLTEAVAIAQAADDGRELALALGYLGAIQEYRSDPATAECLYAEALAAGRRAADVGSTADCLLRLGGLRLARGECAEAEVAMQEALALSRSIGYDAFIALAQRQLARVALAVGDLGAARTRVCASLELADQAEPGTEALGPLRTAASVAVAVDRPWLAVRLLAVEAAWRTRHPLGTDSSLWARWVLSSQGVEEDLRRARAALGDAEFASVWTEAWAGLTLKGALAEALQLQPGRQPA